MSTVGKGLNRMGEIARMFLAAGCNAPVERVRAYVEELAEIPDQFFVPAVRRAMRSAQHNFAPSIGEIWSAARELAAEEAARPRLPQWSETIEEAFEREARRLAGDGEFEPEFLAMELLCSINHPRHEEARALRRRLVATGCIPDEIAGWQRIRDKIREQQRTAAGAASQRSV